MDFVWSPLAVCRSGVSVEGRKPLEIEECGFLPKAATLFLQRSYLCWLVPAVQ